MHYYRLHPEKSNDLLGTGAPRRKKAVEDYVAVTVFTQCPSVRELWLGTRTKVCREPVTAAGDSGGSRLRWTDGVEDCPWTSEFHS